MMMCDQTCVDSNSDVISRSAISDNFALKNGQLSRAMRIPVENAQNLFRQHSDLMDAFGAISDLTLLFLLFSPSLVTL